MVTIYKRINIVGESEYMG